MVNDIPWRGPSRAEWLARFNGAAVVCGAELYDCFCAQPADHETPHLCECEGSWTGSEDAGDLAVVALPNITRIVGPVQPQPIWAGGSNPFGAGQEERMATQTQERTQTSGQGTGQSQKVNAIGAFPESGYAGTVDGSPVAVISTGNVEGMSPAHLVVDEQGLSRWVPLGSVKFTDASLQDTISRSRSSR